MNIHYWLALQRAPGIGPATGIRLFEALGGLESLFQLNRQQLEALSIPESAITYLLAPAWNDIEDELRWAESPQHNIITWQDGLYPALLKQAPGAPLVIYVQGDPALLSSPQLAMVGSRNPTRVGEQTAEQFAHYLAEFGFTLTSGLAFGIDAACHRGALSASQGKTIAVMGTGLNHIYPARHQNLAEAILAQGGALVTEFSLETKPRPENFPRRNRIISGLSLGVLVVEAALQSGSLITARHAMEQGREVFAIPGSIHNPLAKGCHALLKQGAKLVEMAQDIVEEFGTLYPISVQPAQNLQSQTELDADYKALLACIEYEPTSVDTLIERSGLTANVVSSMLLILELNGSISAVPGGYIRL